MADLGTCSAPFVMHMLYGHSPRSARHGLKRVSSLVLFQGTREGSCHHGLAVQNLSFWRQVLRILDPHDITTTLQPPTGGSQPLSLSHRYQRALSSCCLVCRMNAPALSQGIGCFKRWGASSRFGWIGTCKDHRRGSYCSICLAANPPGRTPQNPNAIPNPFDTTPVDSGPAIVENEDPENWSPGVDATCSWCRKESLVLRAEGESRVARALGMPHLLPFDWEARHAIDGFVEIGEGNMNEIVLLCIEKQWLQDNTKIRGVLEEAVAASRYQARQEDGLEYDEEDEFLSEDEEDPELLAMTEESANVREIALSDWARSRILDGLWFNPALLRYKELPPGVSAVVPASHPFPSLAPADGTRHPVYRTDPPPTHHLAQQAERTFWKQLKLVLRPAMDNVVRRIVIECAAEGTDPAVRAAKMEIGEVLEELREPGVWLRGYDWMAERRAQAQAQAQTAQTEQRRRVQPQIEDEDPNGSHNGKNVNMNMDLSSPTSSTHSSGSNATSPVLSTSTLRTTPSPEPRKDSGSSPTMIPIQPVLDNPIALNAIPYIPDTFANLQSNSLIGIEQVLIFILLFSGLRSIH
jgi:hypothetical protein